MDYLLFILLGVGIGVFSGFFGIGGGIILTPLLLMFGLPPTTVIGTSLMLSLGTSISGALSHFRLKNINWYYVIIINCTGIIGTQIAHPLMIRLDSMGFAETVISVFYVALLSYFAFSLLFPAKKEKQSTKKKLPPAIIAGLIGLGAGFISSALGVSGGFFIVPLLISLLGFKASQAVGTSLASVVFIVAAGLISYSLSSPINFGIGLALILGTFLGAPIGARSTRLFNEKKMKNLLGTLYVCMIVSVLSNTFSLSIIGLILISSFALIFFFLIGKKFIALKKKQGLSSS
ncbi:sulfite exporter TauE/SafE family protein [Alkalihalophilus pseudofirmus]|uniref:Probable membrane transporter protein n=1 Tax=Alkalihalophilus pseudofirmus TaxID=79885 RepID=A0AAJ2NKC2_ALKPS|nr:sulfite exporter TauE/SafE family protein [Alkalihalophilus pseudofirmus]MDV2884091.1 sulfite exporter TauE/SafE family protein [Alkalihalophilus pseudofirmus]